MICQTFIVWNANFGYLTRKNSWTVCRNSESNFYEKNISNWWWILTSWCVPFCLTLMTRQILNLHLMIHLSSTHSFLSRSSRVKIKAGFQISNFLQILKVHLPLLTWSDSTTGSTTTTAAATTGTTTTETTGQQQQQGQQHQQLVQQ